MSARLEPVSPVRGEPIPLGGQSILWIGSASDCAIQSYLPGIADHHVALVEREDGWWISAGRGAATVDGSVLQGTIPLRDQSVIALAPGCQYRFHSGVAATIPPPAQPPPVVATRRRDRRWLRRGPPGAGVPWGLIGAVLLVLVLLAGAGVAVWFAMTRSDRMLGVLDDKQADQFDSLMVVAYDHVERGSTLLELGLSAAASQEFARGVNTLALSDLRNNPVVRPRIVALEASVAAIYRARSETVPQEFRGKTTTLTPDQLRTATLTTAQFATAFAQVDSAFQSRFGRAVGVSGRDHAEHLALYGPGGALDLRTRDLTTDQVRFITGECRKRAIRVKDFSEDPVLQDQIRSAIKAGLLDRISTGLHLHIDRFGGRHDRFTVAISNSITSAGT